MRSSFVGFCVYFSACGTGSDIVEFCVIYFCLCCVHVVCMLLKKQKKQKQKDKQNYIFYFSTCGTRSGMLSYTFLHV